MSVTAEELISLGLTPSEAASFSRRASAALQRPAVEAWRMLSQEVLRPEHPFAVHRLLYERAYRDWDERRGPPPAWTPTEAQIKQTNIGRMLSELNYSSVAELHAWSVKERVGFWQSMIERLSICFSRPYEQLLDLAQGVEKPRWFVGAKLNIADSCFGADGAKPAIVYHDEAGNVGSISYRDLESLANRVSNGLAAGGFQPGDALAIYLPMTIESVAIYLGIIRAGCVAVSIADSLAADEIATRLRLADAKGLFTQSSLLRGGKQLPLFAKVVEANAPRAIVIQTEKPAELRPGDIDWKDFLGIHDRFESYQANPDEATNILFSSGTTGEPKAIPWTHVTPIKCAVDACLHQDVQSGDVVAWPTNLGWMMGPWLIYSSLVNRATMALYGGASSARDFGQFVQNAKVTMLGVIPSLVKTWRATECMRGLDWRHVSRFSSTGECSNSDDMLYLMSLAGYKPVIEYCGGTELGGGYIGGTMAQSNTPSTFSAPSFGVGLVLDPEAGAGATAGEIFLTPPSIGMSLRLLHHDHHAVYFEDTPLGPKGEILRRHGDAMERLPGGYYRAQGRVDDTMNLGGIKISSVEIERVLNTVAEVRESAAVAVNPPGGGPSLLDVFIVPRAIGQALDTESLKARLQDAIRKQLNPLFKIHAVSLIENLPRTASHKIMRRVLRDSISRSAPAR